MRKQAMIIAHQIASFHHYSVDFGSCLKAAWNLLKSGKTFEGRKQMTVQENIEIIRESGLIANRWENYGKDRIYIKRRCHDGTKNIKCCVDLNKKTVELEVYRNRRDELTQDIKEVLANTSYCDFDLTVKCS